MAYCYWIFRSIDHVVSFHCILLHAFQAVKIMNKPIWSQLNRVLSAGEHFTTVNIRVICGT